MKDESQKAEARNGQTGVKRATNLRNWRKDAVQIVTVRPDSAGVRATIHATMADSVWAAALGRTLLAGLPSEVRLYIVGPSEKKGRCATTKEAIDYAIADYLNGGNNGMPGTLNRIA